MGPAPCSADCGGWAGPHGWGLSASFDPNFTRTIDFRGVTRGRKWELCGGWVTLVGEGMHIRPEGKAGCWGQCEGHWGGAGDTQGGPLLCRGSVDSEKPELLKPILWLNPLLCLLSRGVPVSACLAHPCQNCSAFPQAPEMFACIVP